MIFMSALYSLIYDEDFGVSLIVVPYQRSRTDDLRVLLLVGLIDEIHFPISLILIFHDEDLCFCSHLTSYFLSAQRFAIVLRRSLARLRPCVVKIP